LVTKDIYAKVYQFIDKASKSSLTLQHSQLRAYQSTKFDFVRLALEVLHHGVRHNERDKVGGVDYCELATLHEKRRDV